MQVGQRRELFESTPSWLIVALPLVSALDWSQSPSMRILDLWNLPWGYTKRRRRKKRGRKRKRRKSSSTYRERESKKSRSHKSLCGVTQAHMKMGSFDLSMRFLLKTRYLMFEDSIFIVKSPVDLRFLLPVQSPYMAYIQSKGMASRSWTKLL